jgi:iron complex outermembrane receptor protein
MSTRKRGHFPWFSISTLALLLSGNGDALAQRSAPAVSKTDILLEEIVVTARKREEKLQDAPISITAFTGEGLEARGLTKLSDIAQTVPNITFLPYNNLIGYSNAAVIFLRGVGQSDFVPTTEPGVGLYVDGVYLGRSVGSVLDIVDLERVEILRGPQGTLFGRNTIGGVVNIVSKKPHDEFEANAEVTVGSDDKINAKGSVNVPIADNFFARFSAGTFNQDGDVRVVATGQDLNDTDRLTGRLQLRWLPVENLTVDANLDYTQERGNGAPTQLLDAIAVFPTGPFDPGNFVFQNNVLLGVNFAGFTGCDGSFANPFGTPTNTACFNQSNFTDAGNRVNTGNDTAAPGRAYFSTQDVYGVSGTIDWQATDWMEVKSITAYRKIDAHTANDLDSALPFGGAVQDIMVQKQVTEELQLLGTLFEARLDWTLGFFYFQEDGKNVNPVNFIPIKFPSGGTFDNDSIAGFGQGTYHFNDKLSLTAGIRYTKDQKRFFPMQIIEINRTPVPFFDPGTPVLPLEEIKIEADDWTPMVNLAYDWSENLMIYATYSEGFKGGGFHQRVFPPLPATPTYDPETVTSYEGGFKYTGFDGRLRVNAAGFFVDYEDLQVTVFTAIAPVVDNAGTAEIGGFELEVQAAPAQGWFVEGGVGYVDAGYDEIDPSTGLTGDENIAYISKWTVNGSVLKEVPIGDYGSLTPRVDWSYRSKFDFDTFNAPQVQQDGYHIVNANIAWENASGRYGLTLGVTNLTDEDYLTSGTSNVGFGWVVGGFGREREWYLTARFRY